MEETVSWVNLFADGWAFYTGLWKDHWILMLFGHLYVLLQITWVHYLAVMNLSRNREKLTPFARYWAYSILVVGYPLDALFNVLFGTLFFLELPHEVLFTSRCNRHLEGSGWRAGLAKWFCKNMLDPFDPAGRHCGR